MSTIAEIEAERVRQSGITHFADDATLARIAELERENAELRAQGDELLRARQTLGSDLLAVTHQRDELRAQVESLRAAALGARQVLWRYRHETPVANQPYMIAHVADVAIEVLDAAIQKEKERG